MARSKLAKAPSAARKPVRKAASKTGVAAKKTTGTAASRKTSGKHVGDVLGVSRARVPTSAPRATSDRGGNPRGIELGPRAKGPAHLKPARARH